MSCVWVNPLRTFDLTKAKAYAKIQVLEATQSLSTFSIAWDGDVATSGVSRTLHWVYEYGGWGSSRFIKITFFYLLRLCVFDEALDTILH